MDVLAKKCTLALANDAICKVRAVIRSILLVFLNVRACALFSWWPIEGPLLQIHGPPGCHGQGVNAWAGRRGESCQGHRCPAGCAAQETGSGWPASAAPGPPVKGRSSSRTSTVLYNMEVIS